MAVTKPSITPNFNVVSPQQMAATQPAIIPQSNQIPTTNFNVGTVNQLPVKPVPQTPIIPQGTTPGATPPPITPGADSNLFAQPGENPQQYAARAAQYQQAFNTTKGTKSPTTIGEATNAIQKAVPPPATPSIADTLTQTDPFFQGLQKMAQEYFSPQNQRTSLVEEYQKLLKTSGIEALDTELINERNIIEGTEDDIRNEITASGGFATNSQVLALTNARNKQLIKNYNTLLETRNAKGQYLDKMLTLSVQDRQEADQRFDQMMNIGFKMQEYRDRMQTNAVDAYQNIADKVGYDALYNQAIASGDPKAVSIIERTLGMNPGGLAQLAEISAQERQQVQAKEQLELQRLQSGLKTDEYQRAGIASSLETDKAQRANIYSQISERDAQNQPINGVDPKVFAKVQASPEYKTINAVLPAISAIKAYSDAIKKYGTTEIISGEGKGTLKGTYGNAIAAWKTLAGLGALSGADFGLAENVIPETGFFQRKSTMLGKLNSGLKNAVSQVENMTKRLGQNYPQASELLNQQLFDMKAQSDPEYLDSVLKTIDIQAMDKILSQ